MDGVIKRGGISVVRRRVLSKAKSVTKRIEGTSEDERGRSQSKDQRSNLQKVDHN